MRKGKLIHLLSALILALFCFCTVSCSNNFDKLPPSSFITHYVDNNSSRIPFDSYWNVSDDEAVWDEQVNGINGKKLRIAIASVDITHMYAQPETTEDQVGLENLAKYFRDVIVKHMSENTAKNPNFQLVPENTKGAYHLEMAITSIVPTPTELAPIRTALVAVEGGSLIKMMFPKGHISMAGRLRDGRGRIVSEFADFEEDHPSILGIDFKDFAKYAHHKHTIDEWAREVAEVYSTAYGAKTSKSMYTINPF